MAAIGLVILAISALIALAGGLANSGSDHIVQNFTILGADVAGSSGKIFLYGAILGATGMLGLNMLLAGIGKGFKNKAQSRRERKQLSQERERLEKELQAERGANHNETIDVTDDATAQHNEQQASKTPSKTHWR